MDTDEPGRSCFEAVSSARPTRIRGAPWGHCDEEGRKSGPKWEPRGPFGPYRAESWRAHGRKHEAGSCSGHYFEERAGATACGTKARYVDACVRVREGARRYGRSSGNLCTSPGERSWSWDPVEASEVLVGARSARDATMNAAPTTGGAAVAGQERPRPEAPAGSPCQIGPQRICSRICRLPRRTIRNRMSLRLAISCRSSRFFTRTRFAATMTSPV